MGDRRLSCWAGVGKLVGGRSLDWCGLTEASRGLDGDEVACPGLSTSQDRVQLNGELHRMLQLLPEGFGSTHMLREFWAIFVAIDLQPFLTGKKFTQGDYKVLAEVRNRCIQATYPFAIALQLLEHNDHRGREPRHTKSRKGRDAAAAARTADQWDTLLAVQSILGRLDAPTPHYRELRTQIPERRERYEMRARVFQLVAALLERSAQQRPAGSRWTGTKLDLERHCVADVTAMIAAQNIVRDSREDADGEARG